MREERKVVTAVFADLVGSTALGERLDPEEVRLVVGEAIARIVRTVEKFGGTVKDLAGDGVLSFFGAPQSHEDDAERAVRAALRIVHEIELYGAEVTRSWGIEGVAVRVGIATGPVVLGPIGAGSRVEYAAFGDTVNTAARLETAATPGTVLVGDRTRHAVESLFEWGTGRPLELKGKSVSVTAWEVRGARTGHGRVRRPDVRAPLIGRERELAAGVQAVSNVLQGTGGILFLSGEAGIGKSRLLDDLRERFEAERAPARERQLWLEGRCVSYGESLPYWPYRDLVREWLGAGADDPELRVRVALHRNLDQLFGDRVGEIYPYLGAMLGLTLEPDAGARLAELSPEALQYRTFEVVASLFGRLAADCPIVVAIEDLHWADPTSLQLTEQLFHLTEDAAVLLVLTQRTERDHPSWRIRELALRDLPHRTRELALEALSGGDRELLTALVGRDTLPEWLEERILGHAEGNPFYLEELIGSLADAGALMRDGDAWRFDHEVPIDVPETVEKVILARVDRLAARDREVLMAASVLGRSFGLPFLEGVTEGMADGGAGSDDEATGTDGRGDLRAALHELQRLDLLREGRRWPQPEYRFKHALTQEAAYGTLVAGERARLHRRAAEWLETRVATGDAEAVGLLAHHWLAAQDEEKAIAYLGRAGDKARLEWSLDEAIEHYRSLLPLLDRRGDRRSMALVLFKLAGALHTSLRFREANAAYQQAFEHWSPSSAPAAPATSTVRMATSYLPRVPDPAAAGWWFDIQLCMQLFDRLVEAWPERAIVPSLAERWEISEDGLRYVFHLREGTCWSDGTPLTAHDVEFGVKRVLDPDAPGASVSVYFVLENGQDYYLRRNRDADRIGVRALDDRTVEFRLAAPAPYFMNVVNRPDGGPQPRHAIEHDGPAWTEPQRQVVSGPFRQLERTPERLVLVRNEGYTGVHTGNVARVEYAFSSVDEAIAHYDRDELDLIRVVYSPRVADHLPRSRSDIELGPAAWTAYLAFDHRHPIAGNPDVRLALAHAIDRRSLEAVVAPNYLVANGGIVPPALHGHTPDIVPRFDPDLARMILARSGAADALSTGLDLAAQDSWASLLGPMIDGWRDVLGLGVRLRTWRADEVPNLPKPWTLAPLYVSGWLPGYPDPEYMLRLLLHTDALTNEGRFSDPRFDDVIDRARREPRGRERLELFHQADRLAVAEIAALIPLVYGRSTAFVKPWVNGWWEFAKTSAAYADLVIADHSAGT
jgi:ABC-type transport system substrate-binding protein/class 3 adenylate cyclase